MNREQLTIDLSPFADIAADSVRVTENSERHTVRMTRDGRPLKLIIERGTGKIECTWGTAPPRGFASFPAMLASEIFANLKRWSDTQRELLRQHLPKPADLLPINGTTHEYKSVSSLEQVDLELGSATRGPDATEVLLIDGPAGIGKTSLIEQLALRRAESFRAQGRPLVLHVKSRGRVLSNLHDLMAFSLQTIRSSITYDQVPVLAKHGLVVLAIDGFDELADPNGYEMAWTQLGELVEFVRGKGIVILAGRDTFIGRDRLLKDVDSLRAGTDIVNSLTLAPATPDQAKTWLRQHQWTENNLSNPAISVLLEADSFALRPVFLRMLEHIKPKDLKDKHERYLTPFLVGEMIRRESGTFGRPVEAIMSDEERQDFILTLLREVARQMADSQTESLVENEIAWMSEIALRESLAPEIVSLIRNRARLIAFFVKDERPGYIAFMHSYLLNYFVAQVAIDSLAKKDIPKFVRRNLLGPESLSIFFDVCAEYSVSSQDVFQQFWENMSNFSVTYTGGDRAVRNVGALLLAALPSVSHSKELVLQEFQIDDAVVRGTCPPARLINFDISQLDCRGADLTAVRFSGVRIGTLIADDALRVSETFPNPDKIQTPGGGQIAGSEEVDLWLGKRGRNPDITVVSGLASVSLRKKPIFSLLNRAARLRQYWLRDDENDPHATKILHDPNWDSLTKILNKHGFLRVESRQASGRASSFYHIKHKDRILAEPQGDEEIKRLFEEMLRVNN